MVLSALQEHLESLYEINVGHRVTDFLITDAAVAQHLARGSAGRERLFVRENPDALDVALYLEPSVLARLSERDPFVSLDGDNLNDFLVALEGVSHFLCLSWNARHDRQITQLELELQAEIDKYVTAAALLAAQRPNHDDGALHEVLFANPSYDAALDRALLERYKDANQFAAKYCYRLAQRFPSLRREPDLVAELRRFYRLARGEKLRRIQAS